MIIIYESSLFVITIISAVSILDIYLIIILTIIMIILLSIITVIINNDNNNIQINVILVIDNEWLAVRLREDSSAAEEKYNNMVSTNSVPADSADLEPPALATVAVAQLSKSGGVVSRDKDARAKHR